MIEDSILTGLEKIFQINRFLNWEISKIKGLSPIQNEFIKFIDNDQKRYTVTLLSEEFNLKKSTVSDSINTLIKKGFINKKNDDHDKRIYYLMLTQKAKRYLDLANKKQVIYLDLINGFSHEEKINANKFIMKFILSLFNKGYINTASMCMTCNNFIEKKDNSYFCKYLDSKISNEELKYNCASYIKNI